MAQGPRHGPHSGLVIVRPGPIRPTAIDLLPWQRGRITGHLTVHLLGKLGPILVDRGILWDMLNDTIPACSNCSLGNLIGPI